MYALFADSVEISKKYVKKNMLQNMVNTLVRQSYNCSSVYFALSPESQDIIRNFVESGKTFATERISFRDCVKEVASKPYDLEKLKMLNQSDYLDPRLVMNSPVFHVLIKRCNENQMSLRQIYCSSKQDWQVWYEKKIRPLYAASVLHNQAAERLLSLVKRVDGNFSKLLILLEAQSMTAKQ